LYYNYTFHKALFAIIESRRHTKREIINEKNELYSFIRQDLNELELERLRRKKEYLTNKKYLNKSIKPYKEEFKEKLKELDFILEKKTKESELEKVHQQTKIERKELEQIQKEKREILMDKESKRAEKIYDLTHNDENVILSNKLTREDKRILKEEGFKQVNEYCIHQKRVITVFVKPIMNHSPTHTFLVWSVKELLEDFEVENIDVHDTRDADITFKHNNRRYAIEIETGNLLKKTDQLKQKILYLNKNYPNRWFFIVSNRNLQANYKKYGISTQRNRVSEILQKMLENTHPIKLGVKPKSTTKKLLKQSLE